MQKITHLDRKGKIKMVDISEKPETRRVAKAKAVILAKPTTIKLIEKNLIQKGDVIATARISGILAAKKTANLIPLTHPINITNVGIDIQLKKNKIIITSKVKTVGRTGPDIEAITAAAVSAITVYDMVKSVDREMTIEKIQLIEKLGGKSGRYHQEIT